MIESKEKAKELVKKMHNVDITDDYEFPTMQMRHAIKCALIAVEEVINSMTVATSVHLPYWKQVKQEIEKL